MPITTHPTEAELAHDREIILRWELQVLARQEAKRRTEDMATALRNRCGELVRESDLDVYLAEQRARIERSALERMLKANGLS